MNFEDYKLELNGVVYVAPCLKITLYSGVVVDNEQTDMSLLMPYHIAIEEFKEKLIWCYYGFNQMGAVKTQDKHISLFEEWLSNPKARSKGNFFTHLRAGKSKNEWIPPGVNIAYSRNRNTSPLTVTEISLPLSWLSERNIDEIKNYVKQLVSHYPLLSGHVGFSFIYNAYSYEAMEIVESYFNEWFTRHPGLIYPGPDSFYSVANKTLSEMGWMTLLGEAYTEQLGGFETIKHQCDALSNVTVEPIIAQKGTLITIGQTPQLGDTENNDDLPTYKQVGKILSSLHDGDYILEQIVLKGFSRDEESAKRWINRFFE